MPTHVLTTGVQFAGSRSRYNAGSGWTTSSIYIADTLANAQAFAFAQASYGLDVDLDTTAPPYKIEITTPNSDGGTANDDYSDRWEMMEVQVQKPIEQHPNYLALASDLKDELGKYKRGEQNFADTAANLQNNANALDFLDMAEANQTHYNAPTNAARWTRTVADGYTAIGSTYTNAAVVFSTSTLLAISKPALYNSAINGALAALPSAASGYVSGWLKSMPTITQRGNNRSDIVQEWVLENWAVILYGNAI